MAHPGDNDGDYLLALSLASQFELEDANEEVVNLIPEAFRKKGTPTKSAAGDPGNRPRLSSSIVAPEWEDLDPTPDLHALFLQFNDRFFWGRLSACEVKWSPRMTLCAGVCSYSPRQGLCSVRLSVPLLKLRPRKDLVQTLLHEMIHAYLFVTDGNDDHDGHGPAFHKHMHRINGEAGTSISVYHTFHDEVALYKQHWWKCNGPCVGRKPFYGMVKRSMNRAPGPYDSWWRDHQASCGGTFSKVKEPEGYQSKKSKGPAPPKGQKDIRSFGKRTASPTPSSSATPNAKRPLMKGNNLHGFAFGDGSPEKKFNGSTKNIMGSNIRGFESSSQGSPPKGPRTKSTSGPNGPLPSGSKARSVEQNKDGLVITLDDSPAKVRSQVKEAWAKKFGRTLSGGPEASSTVTSASAQPNLLNEEAAREDPMECPICGRNVPPQGINAHLDQCLSNQERAPSTAAHPNDSSCPICGKKFRLGLIEAHVNNCIDGN